MPDRAPHVPEEPVPANGSATRRIELTLHKPWFALYAGVRPTLVIAGRGQPTQWGLGTWQVPSEGAVTLGVFLFNRLWRFGQAELTLRPDSGAAVEYRAPALPFVRGRMQEVREPKAAPRS